MWKRLSYDIFSSCLPGKKKFFWCLLNKQKKCVSLIEVPETLGIYKKSYRSIKGRLHIILFKDSYFLKPCRDYVFQVSFLSILKKFKDKCDIHRVVFCFYKFWLSLFLRKVLLYCWSPACFLLFIAPKKVFIMEKRQGLIYLGHTKIHINKPLTISTKKLNLICSTGS